MIALVVGLVSAACSKMEEEAEEGVIDESSIPTNTVIYDGKKYQPVSIAQVEFGEVYEGGTYSYGVFVSLADGGYVYVTFLSASSTFPSKKEIYGYALSGRNDTMDFFSYTIDGDIEESTYLSDGWAIVSKTGDQIEITFNLLATRGGKTVQGNFKGINDPSSAGR